MKVQILVFAILAIVSSVIACGYFESECETAIKNSLLDPGSARISFVSAEAPPYYWSAIQSLGFVKGTFKGMYDVTAKNGFGGYSNESWMCAESPEGNTFALTL